LGITYSPEHQEWGRKITSLFYKAQDLRNCVFADMVDNAEFLEETVVHAVADLYGDPKMSKLGAKVRKKVDVAEQDADLDGVLNACPVELREHVLPVLARLFFLGFYSHAVIANAEKVTEDAVNKRNKPTEASPVLASVTPKQTTDTLREFLKQCRTAEYEQSPNCCKRAIEDVAEIIKSAMWASYKQGRNFGQQIGELDLRMAFDKNWDQVRTILSTRPSNSSVNGKTPRHTVSSSRLLKNAGRRRRRNDRRCSF
jgi:hypothetical protein